MMTIKHPLIVLSNPRNAPGVNDQPRLPLRDWRMYRVGEHTHLVGFLSNGHTCRVSTPIDTVISARRQVQTSSGRLYELDGPPAHDLRALAVIVARLHQLFATIDADVTLNYWDAMQATMS